VKKYLFFSLFLILTACDKVTIDYTIPPLPHHQKDEKPNTPVPLGSIRAFFGDYYRTFSQQLEKVQPVDSFSNVYFYGCNDDGQIHLLRSDSIFVFAIYITGYSLDSLPLNQPLPEVYGKYPQINLYPFGHWDWSYPDYYSLAYYIKKCIFIITDKTDDILTGTFDGMLMSSTGSLLPISEGEFKIKIFRKKMPCLQNNGK
jgi:hypothetical protein